MRQEFAVGWARGGMGRTYEFHISLWEETHPNPVPFPTIPLVPKKVLAKLVSGKQPRAV